MIIGDDNIDGGSGADTIFGGWGDDILRGGPDGDLLVGGPGFDFLDGGIGSDVLYVDEIDGWAGGLPDDTIIGGQFFSTNSQLAFGLPAIGLSSS